MRPRSIINVSTVGLTPIVVVQARCTAVMELGKRGFSCEE